VASQPPREALRRVAMKQSVPAQRRGWWSPSLAGLVVSALGLSVAGSIALASTAQGYPGETGGPRVVASAPALPHSPDATPSAEPSTDSPPDPALAPFVPAEEPAQRVVKPTPELQAARVKERAAQRAEGLAKASAEASRAAVTASSEARQQNLSKAERSRQLEAAKIADENLRKAVAARIAAATERANAEQAATTQPAPVDPNVIPSGGTGVAPVAGAVIGSHFGEYGSWSRYHTGLDFRAAYGTPIRAVMAGRVLYAGNSGDWAGNHVAILHADGNTTMSSHMSSMSVAAGDMVQAGQVIGYVGQTGRAFGAHLHFEVYPAGVKYGDVYRAVDPLPWLRANGVTTH
jgi:murein DD-endopeptidase MepM/ murein hydrolase activator NlpD